MSKIFALYADEDGEIYDIPQLSGMGRIGSRNVPLRPEDLIPASCPAHAFQLGDVVNFAILVNERSASCAEIFTIAVQEGAGIPVVGTTTFGKGIGQSTWKTKEQGVAIITNLEFLSPLGNSYNQEGITPDTPCDSGATLQCGLEALDNLYKKNILEKKQQTSLTEAIPIRKVWPTSGAFFEMN